jgi:hypothetical protein
MIDVEATLEHEFFHIPIAQGITEIPADPTEDHLRGEVAPFEERGSAHAQSPVIRG